MYLNRELVQVAEQLKTLGKQWEESADKLGEAGAGVAGSNSNS